MPKEKEKSQESAVDEPKKIKVSENKRRKLEKPLSAQQRDQVMVKVAKEELLPPHCCIERSREIAHA